MSAQLVLVRHGQTHVNRSGCFQGRMDPELTAAGVAQAEAVAAHLTRTLVGGQPIVVVSSPLRRALATAAPLAAALGATVDVDERLVELDYGEWDGRPLADVSAQEWATWQADPSFAPPGGESLRSVSRRMESFVADVLDADQVTVAVSHVSPIKAAVCVALAADERATWRMHLDLASITRIAARGAGCVLTGYNELAGPVPGRPAAGIPV